MKRSPNITAAMGIAAAIATGTTGLSVPSRAFADVVWSAAAPMNNNAAVDEDRDYYMHMATDGHGVIVAVWCAAVSAATNRDFDIITARSTDGGRTWSDPAELDPYAISPPEIEDDFHPTIATDGNGNWVAAWYTHDDHGGTTGSDIDLLVSHSMDDGVTWSASEPLNSDAATDQYSDYTPSIATDGNGLWIAIWDKPLVTDGDDDLVITRSTDNGTTWSPMEVLHPSMLSDVGDDGSASVTCDANGRWMVVWQSYESLNGAIGDDLDILASTSADGYTWTAPVVVNSDAADPNGLDDKQPRLVTDNAGRWLVTWYYGALSIEYDIRFAYSDDWGATWSDVAFLNTNAAVDSGTDLYPVPATDGEGHWVVVWQSKEPLGGLVGFDYDIFFASSDDNGATWSNPWYLNSFASAMLDFGYDRDPEVLHTGGHRWLTVWGSEFDLGGIGTEYDLLKATACFPQAIGDGDCDADVDLEDFASFQRCYGSAAAPGATCAAMDADESGVVDGGDLSAFVAAMELVE